ncbi:isochorismatase family protein [Mesorhizobium sp. B2-7-1]|uniref:cysteine hydrolase family protein n=1 Tax=Mesorhizobium sp. B2-7-1 TaxID=2589909 RepID=UPI001FED870C|nr:isochorismatase family protein [Mesorhizobium sp. B2-7-1]
MTGRKAIRWRRAPPAGRYGRNSARRPTSRHSAKASANAFSNPDLAEWVAGQGAKGVVLLGAQTDFCVAATVKGAFAEGLGVTVVSDAHSTLDSDKERAPDIIARHNEAFEGQGVRMATTAELVEG